MKRGVVVVTGGTVRLGKSIADRLAADGWKVLRSSHRPDAGADIVADLAEPLGPAKLYSAALALNGGLPPDALVNNAALFDGDGATLTAVNAVAPEKLTMLMAGRETGRGAVVNILDSRVTGGGAAVGDYARTKARLRDYTRRSAAMFAETLTVNAVAPGPVLASATVHERAGECPLGRPGPEAVAAAVAFLLEADFTTGLIIPVDGGQSILL